MGLTGLRSGSKSKDSKSRSELKFEKKLSFYKKVQDAIGKKRKKKSGSRQRKEKKLKVYDLSALSEFLPDLETGKVTVTKEEKINCKSRQTLVQRETAKMQAALGDPSFMSNPFEAIHKQLLETQPPVEKKNKSSLKGKKKQKRKKVKKAKSSTQKMEI